MLGRWVEAYSSMIHLRYIPWGTPLQTFLSLVSSALSPPNRPWSKNLGNLWKTATGFPWYIWHCHETIEIPQKKQLKIVENSWNINGALTQVPRVPERKERRRCHLDVEQLLHPRVIRSIWSNQEEPPKKSLPSSICRCFMMFPCFSSMLFRLSYRSSFPHISSLFYDILPRCSTIPLARWIFQFRRFCWLLKGFGLPKISQHFPTVSPHT